MRKITQKMADAFINNEDAQQGNTRVECLKRFAPWHGDDMREKLSREHGFFLHDHRIAWMDNFKFFDYRSHLKSYDLAFCLCGYDTATTRERLNGIFEVVSKDWGTDPIYIKQVKGKQILTINNCLSLPEYEIDPYENYVIRWSSLGCPYLDTLDIKL